jgi:hypothetical protein
MLSGALKRTAAESGSRITALDFRCERSRPKENQSGAFTIPTGAVQGDLGRNALRGFGATEVDLTLRRRFQLWGEGSSSGARGFFKIFNHPNFDPPINYLSSLYSGNRPRCWARRSALAARMAA